MGSRGKVAKGARHTARPSEPNAQAHGRVDVLGLEIAAGEPAVHIRDHYAAIEISAGKGLVIDQEGNGGLTAGALRAAYIDARAGADRGRR